jgi:hypothetical protein
MDMKMNLKFLGKTRSGVRFMLLILAYFFYRLTLQNLETISDKLSETSLNQKNLVRGQ